MLLALALVAVVIFGTQYISGRFFSSKPVSPVVVKNAPKTGEVASTIAEAPKPPEPVGPGSQPPATAAAEQTAVIDTDLYRIVFSNRGAVVKSWTLKKFNDDKGQPLELVNTVAPKVGYPFAYTFREKKPSLDLNQALYVVKPGSDGLSVDFQYSDGKVFVRKTFEFQKSKYLGTVTSEVTEGGSPILALMQWRGGFGDLAAPNAASIQQELRYDNTDSKVLRDGPKVAKEGPRNTDGGFAFAGLEDTYFTAVFLPVGNGTMQTTTFDDAVATPFNKEEEPFVGIAVGAAGNASYSLFVGPKDIDTLRAITPKLEQIVEFGMFSIIAKPLFLILRWLNDQYVHNYGWSIVLVTIAINILLFPLRLQNMKSMKKMQALQPQIAVINEKYKGIPTRDPRQQQKNEETMALYKKNGANPLGGCIPLVIQMPFLFAFYKVLSVSMEMRSANWFWVHDLSQPEHYAIRILPLILIATGFLMQKMTPVAPGGDPAQQKMMAFMPLMMGFFFWKAQSGLVLYWLTGNVVGIAQQWFFNKTMTPKDTGIINVTSGGSGGKAPARKASSRK